MLVPGTADRACIALLISRAWDTPPRGPARVEALLVVRYLRRAIRASGQRRSAFDPLVGVRGNGEADDDSGAGVGEIIVRVREVIDLRAANDERAKLLPKLGVVE